MDRIACFLAGWLWCAIVVYVIAYWPTSRKHADVDEYVKRRRKA